MFGCICAGRPVQTNLATLSLTQFAFTLRTQPPFHHIVVFLLPDAVLPPDTAAAVYIQLPPESTFRLLGAISNDKQSAIFRINHPLATVAPLQEDEDAMTDETTPTSPTSPTGIPEIMLGISIEPASSVSQQLESLKATQTTQSADLVRRPPSTKVLAQRIIKNAFNFLASFAGGQGGHEVVPLKAFQGWWVKFEKKIEQNPDFLERDADG